MKKYLKSYRVVVHFTRGAIPNDFVNVLAYNKKHAIKQAKNYWKIPPYIDSVKQLDKSR